MVIEVRLLTAYRLLIGFHYIFVNNPAAFKSLELIDKTVDSWNLALTTYRSTVHISLIYPALFRHSLLLTSTTAMSDPFAYKYPSPLEGYENLEPLSE